MSIPNLLYIVYDEVLDSIVLSTDSKQDIKEFLKGRRRNRYQIAEVTDEDHICELMNMYIDGQRFSDYILTTEEFENFSDYIANLNSSIMYDLEIKIINNLKYLKLCDEDKEIINKALNILINKVKNIYQGPTEEDDNVDEADVYYLDKLLERFLIDTYE
jgi:hypothetical protein